MTAVPSAGGRPVRAASGHILRRRVVPVMSTTTRASARRVRPGSARGDGSLVTASNPSGRERTMAETAARRRRWDTDDRFTGVADASGFAAAVDELAALARRP